MPGAPQKLMGIGILLIQHGVPGLLIIKNLR